MAWIDLETGTNICESCGAKWSIETVRNYCHCGAIFKGGELWVGMRKEMQQYSNIAWMRELILTKGTEETWIIGTSQCSFCGRWERGTGPTDERHVDKVFSFSLKGAICDKCVRKYTRSKFNDDIDATCTFCDRKGVRGIFKGKTCICHDCLADASTMM